MNENRFQQNFAKEAKKMKDGGAITKKTGAEIKEDLDNINAGIEDCLNNIEEFPEDMQTLYNDLLKQKAICDSPTKGKLTKSKAVLKMIGIYKKMDKLKQKYSNESADENVTGGTK